ncbi:MAG: LacI family DNA-binding transcriptional regulator [Bacteroidota bacterium]
MREASINDIARELNVSKTTVSFVINGKGDEKKISKTTQKRILDLVEEWNYHPNKIAQALKKGRSKTIGYIVPDISDSFYARVARLLENHCRLNGYQLIIGSTADDDENETHLIQEMINNQIDGLVIAPAHMGNAGNRYRKSIRNDFPLVVFDRFVEDYEVNFVGIENQKSMQEIVQLCISEGFHKIGLISLPATVDTIRERIDGYCDGLRANGMQVEEKFIHIVRKDFLPEDIAHSLEYFLNHGCNAVVATNNLLAPQLIKQVNTYYSSKLDSIRLIMFDDLEMFDFVKPKIYSVAQPIDQIAIKIAELINESIRNSAMPRNKYILKPELITR